jgi:hypothetical protein
VDHSVDIPDQPEHDRDEILLPQRGRLDGAAEVHYTLAPRAKMPLGSTSGSSSRNPADIAGDVGIQAEEDAQQIAAARDAGQLAFESTTGSLPMPCVFIIRAAPGMVASGRTVMADLLISVPAVSAAGCGCGRQRRGGLRVQPGLPRRLVLRGEQIGFGDYADYLPAHHQHRHSADLVLGRRTSDLLVRGDPVNGHHRRLHHVADPAGPPAMPRSVVSRLRASLRRRGLGALAALVQVLLHRVQRAGHVGAGGRAVQGLVVRGTEVPEDGIEVIIPA